MGSNEASIKSHYNSSSIGAYAVSPISKQNCEQNRAAPIVTCSNNESFDEDDDDELDDDGCYENPSAALRAARFKQQQQQQQHMKQIGFSHCGVVSKASIESDNSSNKITTSTMGVIYADSQYDRVDSMDNYKKTEHSSFNEVEKEDKIIGTALVMYAFEGNFKCKLNVN